MAMAVGIKAALIGGIFMVVAAIVGEIFVTVSNNPSKHNDIAKNDSSGNLRDKLAIDILGSDKDGRSVATMFPSHRAANLKNAELFANTEESIRIVTIHGGSWIRDFEVKQDFEKALQNVRVEMLVVDLKGKGFEALTKSRFKGLEMEGGYKRLNKTQFNDNYEYYNSKLSDHNTKDFTIRYYSHYPWIRFTIYDKKFATFVITPFLNPGNKANIFYTEDPWVIDCLNRIYFDFHEKSRVSL